MTREIIPQDPFDIPFMTKVASEIREAKKTIQIVTSEISLYDFLDLRTAAEEAAEKGIKIDVYAKNPEEYTVERLLAFDINVYIGKEDPLDHCLIRDGKAVTVSYKTKGRQVPTPMGQRKAMWSNNPQDVKKYKTLFTSLKKSAKKQVPTGRDPLKELFA